MPTKTFSDGEAVRFGWVTMRNNIGFFIGLLIIVALFYITPQIFGFLAGRPATAMSIFIAIIFRLLQLVLEMGLIGIALKFNDGIKAEIWDIFSYFTLFFRYLFASILYGLIVLAGTILLIVPGIIWGIRFQFYGYFIVDKGSGIIESLGKSSELTQGAKLELFPFGMLLGVINFLGALCLVVGLFATIPTTMVAMAFVYRKLLAQTEVPKIPEVSPEAPPEGSLS